MNARVKSKIQHKSHIYRQYNKNGRSCDDLTCIEYRKNEYHRNLVMRLNYLTLALNCFG